MASLDLFCLNSRRLFEGDVHGGTLVYQRWVWERLARYPNTSLAEDAYFLQRACRQGAHLQKLPHAKSFVYLRHNSNAWRFPMGTYLSRTGWQKVALDTCMPSADLEFYAGLSPVAPSSPSIGAVGQVSSTCIDITPKSRIAEQGIKPLVSCIMPTYNRRMYVPQAIQYFQRQDYPNRELLILDDGGQSVEDLVPPDPCIRYIRLDKHMVLGAKRNFACNLAQGSIIAHWDDDDWIAPHRLSYQVEALERQNRLMWHTLPVVLQSNCR